MMQVIKILSRYTVVALLTLISCENKTATTYDQETRFGWQDFEVQNLVAKKIEFAEPVMKPDQLMIWDTLLVTINRGTEKIFHLFNLKTKEKIGERITVGQGPDEMIVPFFIENSDSIKVYDVMTSTVYSYMVNEFVANQSPIPSRRYKLSEANFFSELASLGTNLVGVSYRPDIPCYLFDANGQKIDGGIGSYPIGSVKYSDLERVDAYRGILASNGTDRFAVSYFFTDLIDIYSDKGKLIKRLHGPEHFFTRFTEYNDGNRMGSRPNHDYYRDAFYSPVSVGDTFFVLYNGKFVNKPEYNLLAKDILVFSWDGTPLKHYQLEEGVSRIAVDSKDRKIYGISSEPEYHIVEYSY